MAIQFATDAYLADRQGGTLKTRPGANTARSQTFADSKGYVMLDQLYEPSDMDEFYAGRNDGVRAKAKKLDRLKGFFEFCVTSKMIAENPARHLKTPVGAGSPANRPMRNL
jgi:hypothetical protein